jgi:hypothetical protein
MVRALEAAGGTLAERLRGGASPATALGERGAEALIPVLEPFGPLFPAGGLRRGSTVSVEGSASLLLALLAGASQTGSWCAAVGIPRLGAAAAAEAGVELSRFAFVPDPGTDLGSTVAALADGVDIVAVGGAGRLHAAEVRRLAARARQRSVVLVGYGGWHGADVRLSITGGRWHGLGEGHGELRAREVTVQLEGRGSASRPRRAQLWLPAPGGGVAAAASPPVTLSGSRPAARPGEGVLDQGVLDQFWPVHAEAG